MIRLRRMAVVCVFATLFACGAERENETSRNAAPTDSGVQLASATSSGRTLGFVLVDFSFEQPDRPPGACPEGWNLDERDLYVERLARTDADAASRVPPDFEYIRGLRAQGAVDPCEEPDQFPAQPHHLMQKIEVAPGFDLDGVASSEATPGPNACAHADFMGPGGERGIDNRLWTALGCIEGYAREGTIDEYAISNIREGQRTILVRLSGVDDLRNDDHVELGLFSSPDPIPSDAAGALMDAASLSITDNPHHRNVIDARIVDGVVSGATDVLRLDFRGQFLESEYVLRDARIRLELLADGNIRGLVGGYWDIDGFFDTYARQASRTGVLTLGFRCPGMLGALRAQADAYPDPETGRCTAISTAFRMAGIPAFVIEPESIASVEVPR
ncbi:MAG: hypothetical protein GY910_14720 [bacterium]|nr:hypothetical protein [Deltaproteobacteria bacterium]MCP4906227.1 hypothetical protein [bacterium]